ncbi:MAG TPA: helix-turn-helix domain-containing protein [Steroidobacteraceae bacterium]|nr:helix-turn-helix domain-containing protein [Steroidobacteraceae bacterium]
MHINTPRQIGANLAGRRKQLKLSQAHVASKLGLSQNRLSELETRPETLTVAQLLALLNILGLEMSLVEGGKSTKSKVEW